MAKRKRGRPRGPDAKIREIVSYDIDLNCVRIRRDVLVGDTHLDVTDLVSNMREVMNFRKRADRALRAELSQRGLSINDAKDLDVPQGLSTPPWYTTRKRGRPRGPDANRSRSASICLKPWQLAKLKLLGGSRWIARMIDQTQPTEPL